MELCEKSKIELTAILEQKAMNEDIDPGSFWLVIYEHRPAVITIAPNGKGFFACGQEELWPLTEVQAWLRKIKVVEQKL